ncbi:MAG: ATP-binding protein [Oligoflexia bacterium]|nr:ATP-binding protein [Oligoflexia bacterium]
MNSSLAEKLDVWGFEEDALIYKDCSLGQVLKLNTRDTTCATDQALNSLHSQVCDFLNGLPQGLSLQFVQVIERGGQRLIDRHKSEMGPAACPLTQDLLNGRVNRLQDLDARGLVPRAQLYLVIRRGFVKRNPEKKSMTGRLRLIAGGFTKKAGSEQSESKTWDQNIISVELPHFRQLVKTIQSGLDALGVSSEKLQPSQVYSILFDQWNPGNPVGPGNFNEEDFRDDVILNDLVVSMEGFSIGSVKHRIISLKIMPDHTFASMSERLRRLPFDSKLMVSIETLSQGKETFALEAQRRIAYALYAGKKGVSDLNNQAKLKDIETLLARRVSGEEKIFEASLTIVLRNESEEILSDQVERVLQMIRELSGAEGMLESLAATQVFIESALPNAHSRSRSRRMNTSVLADFLPILGEWTGHAEPRVLLRSRSGALLGFDPFSPELTNFNQIVSGGSGAGKSFLTNLIIAHLMKEDPKVFILDIGGSYKQMTEHLDGQYVALGANSDLSMNPFDLSSLISANSTSEIDPDAFDQKIKFLVSLVEIMTKEDSAVSIGKLERSEIEQHIQAVFSDARENGKEPCLSDLRSRLLKSTEPVVAKIGKILGPWCGDSPYGKFVDRKTNLALTKKIVCFDLKGLESRPDLQAVCLFIITDLIWREVQKDRTNMKLVVFDECWKLIESDAGSRFIAEVFRTFRKYRASAVAISQTLDDFSKSKVASAILPNASVKWMLKQTGCDFAALQSTLSLNEREMRLMESVTSRKGYFSEAFLIAGDHKHVVAIESTPLEYWLATTDPKDIEAIETQKRNTPEVSDREILRLLARKYPRGASNNTEQKGIS